MNENNKSFYPRNLFEFIYRPKMDATTIRG
jgi:hypothetical protein